MLVIDVFLPTRSSMTIEGTITHYDLIEFDEDSTYMVTIVYHDPIDHQQKELITSAHLPYVNGVPIKTKLRYEMKNHKVNFIEGLAPYVMTTATLFVVGIIMILLSIGGYV